MNQSNVTNYLIPASGQTHMVQLQGAPFNAVPQLVDWRNFSVNDFPFQPQGMIIDNTQAANPVTVQINPLGINITCPAGCRLDTPFPAPNGMTMNITGGGGADVTNIYFVDYPVLPFFLNAAAITGNQNVNIANVTSVNPLLVSPSNLAQGGIPYREQEYVIPSVAYYGSISGAGTSTVINPGTANQNLRRLLINLTGDAAMAAAGDNLVTVTLNGVTIYERTLYIPAASVNTLGGIEVVHLDNDMLGFNAGAGNLTVTISTALSSGKLEVNAAFSNQ